MRKLTKEEKEFVKGKEKVLKQAYETKTIIGESTKDKQEIANLLNGLLKQEKRWNLHCGSCLIDLYSTVYKLCFLNKKDKIKK